MPLRRDLRSQESTIAPHLKSNASSFGDDQRVMASLSHVGSPVNRPEDTQPKRANVASSNAAAFGSNLPSGEGNKVARAESLKIDMSKHSGILGNSIHHDANNKTTRIQHRGSIDPQTQKSHKPGDSPRVISTFDDTETLDFEMSQHVDNQTMVFRGHGVSSHEQNDRHQMAQHVGESTEAAVLESLDPHWRRQVAEQRRYLGWNSHEDDADMRTDPKYGELEHAMPFNATQDTPLRSKPGMHAAKDVNGHTKNVTFAQSPDISSRELAKQWPVDQSAPNQQIDGALLPLIYNILPQGSESETMMQKSYVETASGRSSDIDRGSTTLLGRQAKVAMLPVKSGFESSRASDTTTSSDDGEVAEMEEALSTFATPTRNQTNKKRRQKDDLDHDLHDLGNMTFNQLCREKFCDDPRSSARKYVSSDKSLSEKLEQIDKIDGEELKNYFRSQSDEEWAATGSWFMDKIAQDLKRLIQARCARRKLSMYYENMIRQRQEKIEWHVAGVDDELKELKKGGGELIEGRKTKVEH